MIIGAGSVTHAEARWKLEQLRSRRARRSEPEQRALELEHEHRRPSRFSSRQMPGGYSACPVQREKGACSFPEGENILQPGAASSWPKGWPKWPRVFSLYNKDRINAKELWWFVG